MNDESLFSPAGGDRMEIERAVAALGVTLTREDMDKVAENIRLLTRHREILGVPDKLSGQ